MDFLNEALSWTKDTGEKAADYWKRYIPLGMIYDKLDKASERQIHVANGTDSDVSVFVSADKTWAYVDLSVAILTLGVSMGSSAPSGLEALQSARSLYDIYQATRIWRGVVGAGSKLWNLFKEKGTFIKAGEFECVNKRSQSNPLSYLTPSQYGAIAGSKDFEILIVNEKGQSMFFNSNSDTSWVLSSEGCNQVEYGKIWKPADDNCIVWVSK